MNVLYPLSLSAYYLNFSFPGKFNLETRVFVDMPFVKEGISVGKETNILSFCFEMNSVFGVYENIDSGLITTLQLKKIKIEENSIESDFTNKIKEDSTFNKSFFYYEEKDLYLKMQEKLSDFLMEAYSDNWIKFYNESKNKHLDKSNNLVVYDEPNSFILDEQNKKISLFIDTVNKKFNDITSILNFNNEQIKKYNLIINDSDSLTQVTPNDFNVQDIIKELVKISRNKQYYFLDKNLSSTNNKRNVKKI